MLCSFLNSSKAVQYTNITPCSTYLHLWNHWRWRYTFLLFWWCYMQYWVSNLRNTLNILNILFDYILKILFWLYASGQQQNYEIHQSPSNLMTFPGENTELHCKHSVSLFYTILWYQQSLNDISMKLIGYVYYRQVNVENSFKSHFNVSGDGQKQSTLHLVKVRAAEHSAVYYCAASRAQCSKSPHSATKTSTTKLHCTEALRGHFLMIST